MNQRRVNLQGEMLLEENEKEKLPKCVCIAATYTLPTRVNPLLFCVQLHSHCGSLTTREVPGTSMSWTSAWPSMTLPWEMLCMIMQLHCMYMYMHIHIVHCTRLASIQTDIADSSQTSGLDQVSTRGACTMYITCLTGWDSCFALPWWTQLPRACEIVGLNPTWVLFLENVVSSLV